MKKLLNPQPSKRPSAETVCKRLQVLKAAVGIVPAPHEQVSTRSRELHFSTTEGTVTFCKGVYYTTTPPYSSKTKSRFREHAVHDYEIVFCFASVVMPPKMPQAFVSGTQKWEDSGSTGGTHTTCESGMCINYIQVLSNLGVTPPDRLPTRSHEDELDISRSGIINISREEELDSSDSGIVDHSQTHSSFPGIVFLSGSPWNASMTSKAQTISWPEKIGISFDIPEGAVPPELQLNLSVWPCVSGPFVLPPGYELASPVFIVGPELKFAKEILLRMAHFIQLKSSNDCQRMAFLSAPSTPQFDEHRKPAYHFKVFKKGSFQANQSDGTVNLSHFCIMAIAKETNAGNTF